MAVAVRDCVCIGVVAGITILAPDRGPGPAADITAGGIIRAADRGPARGTRTRTPRAAGRGAGDRFHGLDPGRRRMTGTGKAEAPLMEGMPTRMEPPPPPRPLLRPKGMLPKGVMRRMTDMTQRWSRKEISHRHQFSRR